MLAIRLVLGGVFVYAGAVKIAAPQVFADSIATYQFAPAALINLIALSLPPLEVLMGLVLLSGFKKRAANFSILLLMSMFLIFLAQALLRGLNVDCGCFGGGEPSKWKPWISLGRDILIWIAAFALYRDAIIPPESRD